MKLMLSDGTTLTVSACEKTNTTVNSNTVDALAFTVENTTLEKVKTLFAGGENLSVLHVYSDDNILKDTFNGYEIRKSIALGNTDTSFVVVLAQSTEVDQKLSALTNEVNTIKETIHELSGKISEITESVTAMNFTTDSVKKANQSQNSAIENITKTVNQVVDATNTNAMNIENLDINIQKISRSLNEIASVVTEVSAQYTNMINTISDCTLESKKAVKTADDINAAFIKKLDEISLLTSVMDEVKELVTNNDEKTLKFGEDVSILTETSNAAKLAVERFNEDLSTVSKNAKDAISKTEKLDETVGAFQNTVTDLNKNVETATKAVEDVKEKVTSVEDRFSVLEPITDIRSLSLEDAKSYRINESKMALETYLSSHPITSTCHGGVMGTYSITSEKQAHLQAMILTTTTALANGIDYQPSWNQTGETCTYDWTIEELQQLGIEIEAVVRPLISHQQALEKEILSATTMDMLVAISISYDNIKPNEIVMKTTESETTTEG